MEKHIDKIVHKEAAFNQVIKAIKSTSESLNLLESQIINYEKLLDYYTSPEWRDDVKFSDSKEFPKDIPHGILSEDAFFEEIGNFRALAIRMLKVSTKMLEL